PPPPRAHRPRAALPPQGRQPLARLPAGGSPGHVLLPQGARPHCPGPLPGQGHEGRRRPAPPWLQGAGHLLLRRLPRRPGRVAVGRGPGGVGLPGKDPRSKIRALPPPAPTAAANPTMRNEPQPAALVVSATASLDALAAPSVA